MDSSPSRPAASETIHLLQRARANDPTALDDLLRHVWPRIENWIRRERGAAIRSRFETMDCAQDVAMNLVRYLPNVTISDRETFDRILYRMIQNSLRNKHDYLTAMRRRISVERPLPSDSGVDLDPPDPGASPSVAAEHEQSAAWLRFTLALLDEDDQELLLRRLHDDESFVDIGTRLGIDGEAARMRFNRAMTRLSSLMRKLQQGRAKELFAEVGSAPS